MKSTPVPTPRNSSALRTFASGLLSIALVIMAGTAANAGTQQVPREAKTTQWVTRPPLQQARAGLGVATLDRRIYAVGGRAVDGTKYNTVEVRNVSGDGTWRLLEPLPTARGNLAVAEAGGMIYAIGGGLGPDDTGAITDIVERYDPTTGHWAASTPLPEPRIIAGAASLNGILYVSGGVIMGPEGELITDSALAFDPNSGTWTTIAPMNTAREGHRLVASGGYVYAIGGGGTGLDSLSTVERYDPNADSWQDMPSMQESRWLPCAVATTVGNRKVLVVIAGAEFLPGGAFVDGRRTTEVFDVDSGQWILLPALLPFVRASIDCAVESNGSVLSIGGGTHVGEEFIYLSDVVALRIRPRDLG